MIVQHPGQRSVLRRNGKQLLPGQLFRGCKFHRRLLLVFSYQFLPIFSCQPKKWYVFILILISKYQKESMTIVKILHNAEAGNEQHDKEDLLSMLTSEGYDCRYSSPKQEWWKDFDPETKMLVVAGGDGTVRQAAEKMLTTENQGKHLPIGLLPMGTANNIAKTLEISGEPIDIIRSWQKKNTKRYDVGWIDGMEKAHFFLESFGFGVFPTLMEEMKDQEKSMVDTPEKKLKRALEVLHEVILNFESSYCKIEIDGIDHSGKFLLVEVMNSCAIGPNLHLAPEADPGDGELEIVMVAENHRQKFAGYVMDRINNKEGEFFSKPLQARNLRFFQESTIVHVDDEIVHVKVPGEVRIELQEGRLEFMV
jgi:diacylglycerol kinase family enzyme